MSNDRLALLRGMLAEDPQDPFLRYAIALEHKRDGHMEVAIDELEALLRDDPSYIACYYQLALLQAELGRTEQAIQTCKQGMVRSQEAADLKARTELAQLQQALEGDDDE